MENPIQIGLIGLGVMGQNLARNISNHDFRTVVYNRTKEVTEKFIGEFGNENLIAEYDLEKFVKQIERPRKIIILVDAGPAVDSVIAGILPFLDSEDIVIDCGNSNFEDTSRREHELNSKQILYMGCGVSGGEFGALNGPSLMPGGSNKAWDQTKEIWERIAAKDFEGKPCVTHVGENGAGHFVKMVHNGIEYGVMQIMAEAYDLLRYNLSVEDTAAVFAKLEAGKLKSYLFEIAVKVLSKKDEFNDGYLIDYILDEAEQKGTGKLTVIESVNAGAAAPVIAEAVFARFISANRAQRLELSKMYNAGPNKKPVLDMDINFSEIEAAIYTAMLSTYAQGLDLISTGAKLHNWDIDLAEVVRIWEGGCIIRAEILGTLHKAYLKQTGHKHLFAIPAIQKDMVENIDELRGVVAIASMHGIPVPAFSSALGYFESITKAKLPANFVQGLRDYFGAHTYKRVDKEGTFHTKWDD